MAVVDIDFLGRDDVFLLLPWLLETVLFLAVRLRGSWGRGVVVAEVVVIRNTFCLDGIVGVVPFFGFEICCCFVVDGCFCFDGLGNVVVVVVVLDE